MEWHKCCDYQVCTPLTARATSQSGRTEASIMPVTKGVEMPETKEDAEAQMKDMQQQELSGVPSQPYRSRSVFWREIF